MICAFKVTKCLRFSARIKIFLINSFDIELTAFNNGIKNFLNIHLDFDKRIFCFHFLKFSGILKLIFV
jgi:hypothetical protein